MPKQPNYKKALESIQYSFELDLKNLADRVRTELIIPFCAKHTLQYFAGNNDYFFAMPGRPETIGTREEARDLGYNFDAVFKVLDLWTSGSFQLGHFIKNVTVNVVKKHRR